MAIRYEKDYFKKTNGKFMFGKKFLSEYDKLDLQSAGSSPNLTYTKISALDAIRIL